VRKPINNLCISKRGYAVMFKKLLSYWKECVLYFSTRGVFCKILINSNSTTTTNSRRGTKKPLYCATNGVYCAFKGVKHGKSPLRVWERIFLRFVCCVQVNRKYEPRMVWGEIKHNVFFPLLLPHATSASIIE